MTTTQKTRTFRPFVVGDAVTYVVNLPYSYSESHGIIEELIDGGTALVRYSAHQSARIPLRSLIHKECCDGTGWTGNVYERCIDHYEPNNLSEFSR